jgi:four helix bundle protein
MKVYDLEERTLVFAKSVRAFVKKVVRNTSNLEDTKQLVRSSGSVGANYIEANESLGNKDKLMRIKICRKEAKESVFWLKLIDVSNDSELENERRELVREANELTHIFGSITTKLKKFVSV